MKFTLLALLISTQLFATSRVFKHEIDYVSLEVDNELPYYCDDNAKTRTCLNAQDKKKIKVSTKVFEALANKNWFKQKKYKHLEKYFAQVHFKCLPEDSPKAKLVHLPISALPNRPKISVELQLDCGLTDSKKAQEYMQQTLDYLFDIDKGKDLSKDLSLAQKTIFKKILSGELLNSSSMTFNYKDLCVENFKHENFPTLHKEIVLTCEERYDNNDGTFFEKNCVDLDGKKHGYTKENCVNYYSCDPEDMDEHDAISWSSCDEGDYLNGKRDGKWIIRNIGSTIYDTDTVIYKNGQKVEIKICDLSDKEPMCFVMDSCRYEKYSEKKEAEFMAKKNVICAKNKRDEPTAPFKCPNRWKKP